MKNNDNGSFMGRHARKIEQAYDITKDDRALSGIIVTLNTMKDMRDSLVIEDDLRELVKLLNDKGVIAFDKDTTTWYVI